MKNKKMIIYISFGAMFAAIIMVLTAFLHIPTTNGYIHVGDSFIFIAASFLPFPLSVAVCAAGSALSDLVSGFPIWILPTFIIKGMMAACFSAKSEKFLSKRNIIALPIVLVILCGGYYVAESLIYGNWITSLPSIFTNAIQGVASITLFVAIAICLDKSNLKKKLLCRFH